jgi:hypothetical protein
VTAIDVGALANSDTVIPTSKAVTTAIAAGGGMVYPGAGIPISTGSAWGTSLALAEQRLLGRITGEITGALTAAQAWGILAYGNTGLSIPYFSAVNTIALTNPTLAHQLLRVNAGGTGYEWDTIGSIMSGTLDVTYDNLAILSWQLAIHAGLSLFKLEDGVTDEFEDETGVNTASSTYEVYNSTDDYYAPDSPDQIPEMTSDTAPSGIASVDSIYNANYPAWKAMDNTNIDHICWLSGTTYPHWLRYQFASGKTITSYSITSRNYPTWIASPTAWKLQGSTNGSSWTDLDTQTSQSFSNNEKKTYSFSNSTSYTYYRLYITAGVDADIVAIGEWELILPFDMTLISNSIEAELQPTKVRFMALVEPVNAITLNTDIKGWISEDNAAHYDQVTLTDEGYFDATKKIYAGSVNLTDYTDKTMVQKITTHNGKNLKVHAWAMMWR